MTCAYLFLAVLLAVLDSTVCELEFCDDAYQRFLTYSDIWKNTRLVNKFSTDRYTAKYLEDYAKNICSVVKPQALNFFRSQVAGCQNIEEIVALVDENRGFCSGNNLNARAKQSIIDRLPPVDPDDYSQCATIDNSTCYSVAADKLREKRLPISSFRNETDKFFDSIWECQVNVFKSHSSSCPNWQLPLLLSLDTMDVPTLFQVRLTDQQVAMLELNKRPDSLTPTNSNYVLPRAAPTRTKNKKMKKKKKKNNKNKKKVRKAKKVKLPKFTIKKPKKTMKVTFQKSSKGKSGKKSG